MAMRCLALVLAFVGFSSAEDVVKEIGAAVECINNHCPMSAETMAPSAICVVEHCVSALGKCVFHSQCRNELHCVSHCTAPLAKSSYAQHFIALQTCMKNHCPGFPPSKKCVALHCGVEAAECGTHSECRHALECSDKCTSEVAEVANSTLTIPSSKEVALPLTAPSKDPAAEAIGCLNSHCPMNAETMTPSPACVVENCAKALGNCVLHSACRSELLCMNRCTAPLAHTDDAVHFLAMQSCLKDKCPGFPPSKSCVAMHCGVEAGHCAVHSKCRHALECADSCSHSNSTLTIV